MTEITKTVEKDIGNSLPYKFRCRWFGYYDEEFNGVSPIGLNKSESDLTAYDGLDYYKEAVISPNVIRVGNPTIDDIGVANGFSATKFFQLPTAFNPGSDRWEMYFKVKPGASSSTIAVIFHSCFGSGASGRYGIAIGLKSGKMIIDISSNGTSWIISDTSPGSFTYTTGTWYWIKFGRSVSEYYVEYSTDGETYTRDLTFSSTDVPYGYLTRSYVGAYSTTNFSNPWTGSIDLSECYIKTASQYFPDTWQTFWEGTYLQGTMIDFSGTVLPWKWGYQRMLKTSKYAIAALNQSYSFYGNTLNGTITGTPSISPDRLMSGFSQDNYLTIISQWKPSGNPWKIHLKITTGATDSLTKYLFGQPTTNFTTPQLDLVSKSLKLYLSSNMSSWDIVSGGTCSIDLEPNTTYDVDVEFTGTAYTVSVDGVVGLTVTTSTATFSGTYPLILGFDKGNNGFNGSIDLGESYVTINGEEVWRGFSKTILSGCINGDMDSNGEYYCYAINGDDHIELQKKTGGTIIAQNTNPRYLGEVNVLTWHQITGGDIDTPV